uniref:Uncharacterized protein n=1 Tax=Chenopodium quinoa TaxID=63459 RepID=A0A803N3Z8_CHEQI
MMHLGTMIHGRLIEDQIESVGQKFYFDGHYQISNAPIKPMPRHFETAVTNNPYQLTFVENTVGQPICCISGEVEPEFKAISAIVKTHLVAFTFDVVDNTDRISLTTFNNNAVKILGIHVEQIYTMKRNEDHISFEMAKTNFSSKLLHMKVAPTPALSATNKLQWSLEAVIIKEDRYTIPHPDTASPTTSREEIDKKNTIIESMGKDKTMEQVEGNTENTRSITHGTVSITVGVKDSIEASFPNRLMHK